MLHLSEDHKKTLLALPSVRDREAALDKIEEEALELSLAIHHWRDGRGSMADVLREMADALVTIEAFAQKFSELRLSLVSASLWKISTLRDQFRSGEPPD